MTGSIAYAMLPYCRIIDKKESPMDVLYLTEGGRVKDALNLTIGSWSRVDGIIEVLIPLGIEVIRKPKVATREAIRAEVQKPRVREISWWDDKKLGFIVHYVEI